MIKLGRFLKKLPIILVILVTAFLYIWKLWDEGLANLYYSAGVYSMGQNFHAFFFNSLDSVGFISIDKPALGLWIQVLFTKVFGFQGLVILLPEAIAGILSVFLIYRIVGKRFGEIAGIASALVLAMTPIYVAITRNNTIDGILILLLILASEQVIRAAERSSLKHLIFASIFIGLAFNVKMLQAYMIVPAVYLTFLVFSNQKIWRRLLSCAVGVIVMLVVSFSWILAVDFTPTSERPFVGSSGTNSEFALAFGYNGINRLAGGNPSGGGIAPVGEAQVNGPGYGGAPGTTDGQGPSGGPGPGPGGPGQAAQNAPKSEGGTTSLVRLYQSENAGQISWFLFPALLASLYCLFLIIRKRLKQDSNHAAYFFFTVNFLLMFGYFSFSNGMVHRYYLAMLAFPIAALVGIGISKILSSNVKYRFLLPAVFGLSAAFQLYIQAQYADWVTWLLPICAAVFLVALVVLIFAVYKKYKNNLVIILALVLLVMPFTWALSPMIYTNNAQLPITGPELVNQGDHFAQQSDLSDLVKYLKEHKGGASYLASISSAMNGGAELILQSGEAVMALGGFNGSDNPITLTEFKALVSTGKVKYAVFQGDGAQGTGSQVTGPQGLDTTNENAKITTWITTQCKLLDQKYSGYSVYELIV